MPSEFIKPPSAEGGETELCVYDVIGDSYWGDEVSAKQVVAGLSGAGDVHVRVNCLGGCHQQGTAIYNALANHSGSVRVTIEGYACSMATVISAAANQVDMCETGMVMVHKSSMVSWGNADEMRSAADQLDKADSTIVTAYQRKTGKTAEEIQAVMAQGDVWMTAAEAKDFGLVDNVVTPARFAVVDKEGVSALAVGQGAALLQENYQPPAVKAYLEGASGITAMAVEPLGNVVALSKPAAPPVADQSQSPVDLPTAPAAGAPPAPPAAPPDANAVLAAERQRSSDIMAAAKSVGISASSNLVQQAIMNGTPADQVGPMFQAFAAAVDERINSPAPNQPEGGAGSSSVWDRARAGQAGGRK